MRKYALFLSLLSVCFMFVSPGAVVRASAAPSTCAWQSDQGNAGWPDLNAQYWITSFTSQPDLTITVHGAYPSARYFSITAYNAWGIAGPANVIHDSQIVPDPDGNFTVTVSHTSGPNTISFANVVNGTTGYLMFRVFVPNGSAQLPSLTFTNSAGSVSFAVVGPAWGRVPRAWSA